MYNFICILNEKFFDSEEEYRDGIKRLKTSNFIGPKVATIGQVTAARV